MLEEHFSFPVVAVDNFQVSSDRTIKSAFRLYDNNIVEGVLIPMLGFVYVGGAWLFVKVQAMRRGARQMKEARETESFAAHPALAKRPPVG